MPSSNDATNQGFGRALGELPMFRLLGRNADLRDRPVSTGPERRSRSGSGRLLRWRLRSVRRRRPGQIMPRRPIRWFACPGASCGPGERGSDGRLSNSYCRTASRFSHSCSASAHVSCRALSSSSARDLSSSEVLKPPRSLASGRSGSSTCGLCIGCVAGRPFNGIAARRPRWPRRGRRPGADCRASGADGRRIPR